MTNFNDLVNNAYKQDKVEEYLLNFFNKKNYKEYEIDDNASLDQIKAIRTMFNSRKDLRKRIDDAFAYDLFCVEAFFAYLMINEDVFLQLRFNTYYKYIDDYPDFDLYEKNNYIRILNLYVDFLSDIRNITKAISILKMIIKLTNQASETNISRLAYMYFMIEDDKEFYKLYTNYEFATVDYLLLMVTLLKHDEELKAQEVLLDMFDNIECSTYLDHIWDLDEDDIKQQEFYKAVDGCFDDILSIPTFFSWVNKVREKHGK